MKNDLFSDPDSAPQAIYALSSHWDREWYLTFQQFRHRLVQLLDSVLEDLNEGKLSGPFYLDGQAIQLEDYLEIRPEQKDAIQKLLREGKLIAGPWYCQPDEWLVAGESLLRNLEFGSELVGALGGTPSISGFCCDQFGQIGQMPQLFAGFGIEGVFLWRGLPAPSDKSAWVKWVGVDGTALRGYRFGHVGYCDFAHYVRGATDPDLRLDQKSVDARLDDYIETQKMRCLDGPVFLFDGGDHLLLDRAFYSLLRKNFEKREGITRIVHGSPDDLVAAMLRLPDERFNTITGELREASRLPLHLDQSFLIPGVLSSRVWIKQENNSCETLLTAWAEPFSTIAHTLLGSASSEGFLKAAWRWLLQNHPHDTICGCSVDQVHEDMRYRFAQCRQISETIVEESLLAVARATIAQCDKDRLRVVIFNPMPIPMRQVVEVELDFPETWPRFAEFFHFEKQPAFRLRGIGGEEVSYQRISQKEPVSRPRLQLHKFPSSRQCVRVRVAVEVNLPALGYTSLDVEGEPLCPEAPVWPRLAAPTRQPAKPSIVQGARALRNEHLEASVSADGTLTVIDLATGQKYGGLLVFEDCCDIGDGWYHGPSVNDEVYSSHGAFEGLSVKSSGPLLGSLVLRHTMVLPSSFAERSEGVGRSTAQLRIETTLTLKKGGKTLECVCRILNNARDHRVRVAFESGVEAGEYRTDSAFDVVSRPVDKPDVTESGRELEVETVPQRSFTAISAGERGMAIIAPGLHETCVRDDPQRTIYLTLFRGTSRTVLTNGEQGGQLQGLLEFRFLLGVGAWASDDTQLLQTSAAFNAGVRSVQLGHDDAQNPEAILPRESGFLEITGDAHLSAFRKVRGELELRAFNPKQQAVDAGVLLHPLLARQLSLDAVRSTDFLGNAVSPGISSDSEGFPIRIEPKKITNIRVSSSHQANEF